MSGDEYSMLTEENPATLKLQMFVCSVCGEDHETETCGIVESLKHVPDSKILSRARLTLPKDLYVKTLADGSTSVLTRTRIDQGTQFGPFQAPLTLDMHPAVSFPLKVFGKTSSESYYLDTTDEESCNWMCLVATATSTKEQNLICYDIKQFIYFTTTRDVLAGEELRVWYALFYGLKLQALPLADDSSQEEGFYDLGDEEIQERLKLSDGASVVLGEDLLQTLAQHLPAHALGASGERDVWICKLCGGQESNVASYARHLMAHYRQQEYDSKHPQCKMCLKRFLGKKVLDSHVLKVHQNDLKNGDQLTPSSPQQSQPESLDESQPPDKITQNQDSAQNNHQTKKITARNSQRNLSCNKLESKRVHQQLESKISGSLPVNAQVNQGILLPSVTKCDETKKKIFKVRESEKVRNFPLSNNVLLDLEIDRSSIKNSSEISIKAKEKISISTIKLCDSPQLRADITSTSKLMLSSLEQTDEKEQDSPSSNEIFNVTEKSNDPESEIVCGESFIIPSGSESTLPTSYKVVEAQNIDGCLKSREPFTFIMVNACDTREDSQMENTNLIEVPTLMADPNESNISDQGKSKALCPKANAVLPGEKTLSYNCDICQKSFEKCSYLYRHLRKHTGEFTCISCLAVFARKENLQAHSCTQPKEWFPCPVCGRKFSAKKYLQRHSPIHTGEFTCSHCSRCFVSCLSLKVHRCLKIEKSSNKAVTNCILCEREFDSESKLQSHLQVHSGTTSKVRKRSRPKPSVSLSQKTQTKEIICSSEQSSSETTERKVFICEICGAIFKSSSSMKTHRFLHGERKFECHVCKKRFHRKDVLQDHLTVHREASFPCEMCGKKYKTKKSLYVHSLIHKGAKRFSCRVCAKEFFQKGNLIKHEQTHTSERMYACEHCNKCFISKEYFNMHQLTHTQGKIYNCDECKKSFVKKHMLDNHRQLFHSNRGYLCKYCNTVIRHKHSIRRHLELRHSDQHQEWSAPGFIDILLVELPQNLLHLSGDSRLTPSQQQERQKQLESLRNKHFQTKSPLQIEETESSHFIFSPIPTSEHQICQLNQADPLVMLQSSTQLTLVDNFLTDYDPTHASTSAGCSLMVSGDTGSEGEILLTLVEQTSLSDSGTRNTTPVLTSAALGSDIVGLDSGTAYMMDNGSGSNSVLLYVVETSNGAEGDSEDLVWCNEEVPEQL